MISFRISFLVVFALLALTGTALRAHDPYDVTSQARILPEGIELRLTVASSTARRLLTGKAGTIAPAQFDVLRSEFERRAPQFMTLSAANTALVPTTVAVELTEEGDVKILLRYSPPTAARLRLQAALLEQLPREGYTVFLLVRGSPDERAVAERLTLEKPACDLPVSPR